MTNPMLELTPEVVKQDGQGRVAKTAGQTGSAMAVVTVSEWLAHQAGWHGHLPPNVALAMAVMLTTLAAVATNWSRLKGRV
jgi:hypothetical protein